MNHSPSLQSQFRPGLWKWAKDLWLTEKHGEAIAVYEIFVRKFSNTPQAQQALVRLVSLYQETGRGGLSGYLNGLVNRRRVDEKVRTIAFDLLAGTYILLDMGEITYFWFFCNLVGKEAIKK